MIREEQLAGLQRKLTELLKANQFNSVDEMDAYMQKTLNENTLADWNEFKKTYDPFHRWILSEELKVDLFEIG